MKYVDKETKGLYIAGWIILGSLIFVLGIGKILSISFTSLAAPCLIHGYTGLYCPGCGGTRAVISLTKGQILQSLILHPVVPYTAAIFIGYMGSNTIQLLSKGRFKIGMKYNDIYLWIALLIILINFIIKNIVYLGWGIPLIN